MSNSTEDPQRCNYSPTYNLWFRRQSINDDDGGADDDDDGGDIWSNYFIKI